MVVQAHTVVRSPKKDHIGRLFLTSENDLFKCSQIGILNPLRAAFIAKLKKICILQYVNYFPGTYFNDCDKTLWPE